ncbi:tRNA1(Val) (adenine(37)-N6)-methyltransferase [Mucilaginibacter sp. OK283]|jgi:tRNA1Val (adenine37-N6)-methyltransferase|uniref:tRNA1(Val) (adenine(37)-N6)-methyltransferase n=1 Tax=Mucilaginibacter sp. OK283 TaxID=1881049 RepID=UPI0008D6DF3F|nr:methyltransferase [Mucilaginibacter sp. OK283]SEO99310.1 tRNA1Val (adenine37-N6)-methyltransferase [Mucilaginibacter sp. OK283]
MFHFKQFSVDQSGCAMKINTDGVLLGALATADAPKSILDIGTGTGVIALMLAQRFANAQIDAVEIDENAAKTAGSNFENSPFADRLAVYLSGFQEFFKTYPEKRYDVIVSNPPFYINSLLSPGAKKNQAKHADGRFFEELIKSVSNHLAGNGVCWLVLPPDTAEIVKVLAERNGLYLQKAIKIRSFEKDEPHREILMLGFQEISTEIATLTIYKDVNVYSEEYKRTLQPYFLAF